MSRLVESRAPGAFLRACLVALLVALPQLLLGHGRGGNPQLVTLVALMAALFVLNEYAARAPSLVEFRDARPYNRLRVATVLVAILVACALLRPDWEDVALARPLRGLGQLWAGLLDLSWSPVPALLRTLPVGTPGPLHDAIFAAAATSYGLSLLRVVLFALLVRVGGWPRLASFNVWVNLPQFDPTAGGDVVVRLQQNALVNVSLGLLLPLIIPIIAGRVLRVGFEGAALRDPAALVWVVVAWAFIPASLAMRGLALHRLALLITVHRRRHGLAQLA